MFAGLDEIGWQSMEHAYGPAVEVPELIRGLVSGDPAVREVSLDGMEGAVHHQGDVYECTLATIPFLLEAAVTAGLPGRDEVLGLLGSIGGADSEDMGAGLQRRAAEMVAAACPSLLALLTDNDALVRAAVGTPLLVCRADGSRVAAALSGQLSVESDVHVRATLVGVLGELGRRAKAGKVPGVDVTALAAELRTLASGAVQPRIRLAALTEYARCGPDTLPPEVVPELVGILTGLYAEHRPQPKSESLSTPTLRSYLREAFAREAADHPAPELSDLIREVSWALGDRVESRVQLLTALLRATGWGCRHDSLYPASDLVRGWRGDFRQLIALVGEQVLAPQGRLGKLAASILTGLGETAAPAGDSLARCLQAAPHGPAPATQDGPHAWIIQTGHTPAISPALGALAALRDVRALPIAEWVISHETAPEYAGDLLAPFGQDAAPLVPLLRRRLRDVSLPQGYRTRLVVALGEIGAAAAAAVPDLVVLGPTSAVVRTLGQIGPAAAEAAPLLRSLLDDPDGGVAVGAASALWRIESDPALVLPVFSRCLTGDRYIARRAADGLAEIGPAAAAEAPRLREMLETPDEYGWLHLGAAAALWRTTGDAEAALPKLIALWEAHRQDRKRIVGLLGEMGPAASAARPLVRAELDRRLRHKVLRTVEYWDVMSSNPGEDDAFLRECRSVLDLLSV